MPLPFLKKQEHSTKDRLSKALSVFTSKAGTFPNYSVPDTEDEDIMNCKRQSIVEAKTEIDTNCSKEISRGKRRKCIGYQARKVCKQHNKCVLSLDRKEQLLDCDTYVRNSINLMKEETAPQLRTRSK